MTHKNYRVVEGAFGNVRYFYSIEEAKKNRDWCNGQIECYVYGYGWVRWCEAMREVTA